jgi:hypothetical protein
MPSQRFQTGSRLVAAAAVLFGLVGFGLADWSGTSAGYVVAPGDSLWAIAADHHVTVEELAAANHLDPAAVLPIGLHLYLPSSSGESAASSAVASGSSGGAGPAFCAGFEPSPGPTGVLPAGLSGSTRYYDLAPVFEQWASYYGVSLPLLEAIAWQESGWQQGVVSPTGAVGVGQIEPGTASFIADDLVGEPLDASSVSDNIRMSAAFVSYLAGIEGGNRCATIAAYYEGPLNLRAYGVLPDATGYVADVEALEPRFS